MGCAIIIPLAVICGVVVGIFSDTNWLLRAVETGAVFAVIDVLSQTPFMYAKAAAKGCPERAIECMIGYFMGMLPVDVGIVLLGAWVTRAIRL